MPDQLTLIFRFGHGGQDHQELLDPIPGKQYAFGRADFSRWFGLSERALQDNVSKLQFKVWYDLHAGKFRLLESSRFGTDFRRHFDEGKRTGPWEWRIQEEIALSARCELRIRSGSRTDLNDIYVLIQRGDATTGPLPGHELCDELGEKLRGRRSAHLVGLPGAGKSHLVKRLLELPSSSAIFGVSVLPIELDGHSLDFERPDPPWRVFVQSILTVTKDACIEKGKSVAADLARQRLDEFSAGRQNESLEALPYLRRLFSDLRAETYWNPLLILSNFDGLYVDLPAATLYTLTQLHAGWPHLYLLLITHRDLALMREEEAGPDQTKVQAFNDLFLASTIRVNYLARFAEVWRSVTHDPLPDAEAQRVLTGLTGNYRALLEDVVRALETRRWLNDAGRLDARAEDESWLQAAMIRGTCENIWKALGPHEQQWLRAIRQNQPVSDEGRQRLQALNLLLEDGSLFSRIFASAIDAFDNPRGRVPDRGLFLDTNAAYVNGRVVLERGTREFAFLHTLYQRPNELVTFETLLTETYDDYNGDPALRRNDRERLTRLASRVAQKIDPDRLYIKNHHGQGYRFETAKT